MANYDLQRSGPWHAIRAGLLAIDAAVWVATLAAVSIIQQKTHTDPAQNAANGLIWFTVFFLLLTNVVFASILGGVTFLTNIHSHVRVIAIVLLVVIINAARLLLDPTKGTGRLHSAIQTLFGGMIVESFTSILILVTSTGELDQRFSSAATRTRDAESPQPGSPVVTKSYDNPTVEVESV